MAEVEAGVSKGAGSGSLAGDHPSAEGQSEGAASPAAALTLTVAFAGHRSLPDGDLHASLKRVFGVIREALTSMSSHAASDGETIHDAHATIWSSSPVEPTAMRLLVGYAPGADRIAVQVWRSLGLGRIHGLFPFADPDTRHAWTDEPTPDQNKSLRVDIEDAGDLDAVTVLDGAAALVAQPFRDPHLEHSRWLQRWSDIVVVAWDGKLAAGRGGTGDLVALALASIQPVIWIDVSRPRMPIKVIMPMRLWRDTAFSETLVALDRASSRELGDRGDPRDEPVVDLSVEAVESPLLARFRPPSLGEAGHKHDQETFGRRDYSTGQALGDAFHDRLARKLGGLWPWVYRLFGKPEPRGETEPRAGVNRLIEAKLGEAEEQARELGNLHRAAQLVLLVLAVLAVLAGTFPAVKHEAKIYCVAIEWTFIIAASAMYFVLGRITTNQRWSDARRLAERLRALDATWPLGFDVGDERSDAPSTWTEWYARAVRRAAGPPTGFLSQAYRRRMGQQGRQDVDGIVRGQCRYHKLSACRAHRFHKTLRAAEVTLTLTLLLALTLYIVRALVVSPEDPFLQRIGGGLLMASAVVPAIAAACLGIEAKLGLTEVAHRSAALRTRFDEIFDEMQDSATQEQRQEELLRAAATLAIADVDRWRDASAHRLMATF